MSEKLGPLHYSEDEEEVFLGHSVTQRKNISDATAKIIDEEIRAIIEDGENFARKVLKEHEDDLHTLAKGLLEYETLSGDDIKILLDGGTIVRQSEEPPSDAGKRSSVPASGPRSKTKDKSEGPAIEPEPQPEG